MSNAESIRHRARPVALQPLADVVASLRAPDGCPWDRAQTHASLRKYATEEAYELVDAIEADDPEAIREELGDVLLQVVLHAQLAAERGDFDLQDVCDGIRDKMLRRHPHVFGDASAANAAEVEAAWKEAKRREGRSALGGVPRSMPPLERASRITERAGRVGFDFETADDAVAKVVEEVGELREAVREGASEADLLHEIGDVLFSAVNVARKLGLSADDALRGTIARFERRFAYVEGRLAETGRSPEGATLAEMDALWDESKAAERSG